MNWSTWRNRTGFASGWLWLVSSAGLTLSGREYLRRYSDQANLSGTSPTAEALIHWTILPPSDTV